MPSRTPARTRSRVRLASSWSCRARAPKTVAATTSATAGNPKMVPLAGTSWKRIASTEEAMITRSTPAPIRPAIQ